MRYLILIAILISALFLSGCAITKVSEIKTESMVGETVRVSGEVKSTFKVGSLSGYVLQLEDGELWIASKSLPEEGKKVTVKGIVMKELIVGYYVLAKE
jgi:hypothetical protein